MAGHTQAMSESPTLASLPASRPKKSPFRLLKRLILLLLLVIVLAVIAGYLLQNLIGKTIFNEIVSEASAALGTEVRCETVEFTWRKGFELRGFRIANPQGFGPTAALEIQSAKMDLSLTSLLFSKFRMFDLHGKLVRPEIEIRKNREGWSNWEQLAENQRRYGGSTIKVEKRGTGKVRSGKSGNDDLTEIREMLRNVKAEFSIEKGRVQFIDEQRGERHAIEELQVKLASSKAKKGALFHLGGILTGANNQKSSEVSIMATLPFYGQPTFVFKAPDGIRIQDYHGLISPFLETDFESFAGLVRGEIRASYEDASSSVDVEGILRLENLDLVGGPLGKGIGVRTTLWTLEPSISMNLSGGKELPNLQGTQMDLGFLKLSVIPPESARQLLAKESQTEVKTALGLTATLDLDAMAGQILHPALQGYSGKVNLTLAMDPAIQETRTLPLVLLYDVKELGQDQSVTGLDFVLPPALEGKVLMEILGGEEVRLGPLIEETKAPGLVVRAKLEPADAAKGKDSSIIGKVLVQLDPAKAAVWLRPNLPADLSIDGPINLNLDLSGGQLGKDFPVLIQGKTQVTDLSFEGNRLEKGSYNIRYERGRLQVDSEGFGTLNKGPMQIRAMVEGLDKPKGDLDFRFQTNWKDGVAAWGLTPYLQYAFPFLAGLDIQKGAELAKLDYRSFASLDFEISGKIPADEKQLSKAMSLWSGKGRLSLKDGAFTPSKAFSEVMKLFGTKDKLRFREFANGFEINKGRLEFKEAKIGGRDGHLLLRGYTGLDGKLDLQVDFTDLLSRHRDGKRILAATGGKPILVKMGGTLTSPDFPIQNLVQDLLKDLLENTARDGLKNILKDVQKGKKPEDALKDLFKKFKR